MAQKKTTKTTRSAGSGRSSGSSASRSRSGGSSSRSTRSSRSGGNRSGGNGSGNSGMMILLKSMLFVLAIAVVFGFASWGLEKLGEKGDKNSTVTTTPTGGAANPSSGETTPGNGEPTDTPTPVPTQSLEDRALTVLKSASRSQLKLSKELSAYRVEVDDYTSNIRGKECVGVNVLDGDTLTAIYYVAVDGSEIFREREDGDFDSIIP